MNQRNLISGEMGIIIGIIFTLILTYFGISFWISVLIAFILIIILANTSTVDSGSGSTAEEHQQQVGTPSRDYTGSIISIIFLVLVIVVGWWAYDGISETPDKVYSAQELLSYKISGDCKVIGNEFVCNGPWTIFIPGKKNILTVKIFPADREINLTKNLSVWSGPYFFRVTHAKERCDRPSLGETDVYKGEIFYGGLPEFDCTASILASGAGDQSDQLPIKIGTDWSRSIVFWRNTKNPSIWIGKYKIAWSTIKTKDQVEFGGDLVFSSDQGAKIKKIEVIY